MRQSLATVLATKRPKLITNDYAYTLIDMIKKDLHKAIRKPVNKDTAIKTALDRISALENDLKGIR